MSSLSGFGVAGFYGKAVTYGDFLLRGLPPCFVEVWDAWLQTELHGSRKALGSQWLDQYLRFPVWRFALESGVCGASCWAGVMMPGVDRVGRYFPMTAAAAGPADAALVPWVRGASDWYDSLDDIVRSSLRRDYSTDAMASRLSRLAAPPAPDPVAVSRAGGHSYWWVPSGSSALELDPCAGLPAGPLFLAILNAGQIPRDS